MTAGSKWTAFGITPRNKFMMAQRAILMGDTSTHERIIMAADNPRDYKALGREVQHFDAVVWDHAKYNVVFRGNPAKKTSVF